MQIVKEIRRIDSDKIMITIPKEFRAQTVEIVVSSIEQPEHNSILEEQLRAVDELSGLISDLTEKEMEEFDRTINERIPFRRNPVQL